jgi:peptidoglycan hydrolase-like protein with peptidoglycan-binding domain
MTSNTRKIVAGLLSLAMVLTLVGSVAVSANAQTVSTYTRNLTVGSRGNDVVQLQALLASKGFFSLTPTGYFGSITKAAVSAWQASVGLPSTGYFGPLSRAAVAGMPAVPGTPVPGTPSTLDNTDGSITATQSSLVATGAQIKKGETKDVVAVEFQATAGNVAVTRFDVRFSVRPWLYFSKVELKGSNGAVLATKNITGASDFTEITAGSDYLLRFEGLNFVVSPSQKQTITVDATVLASTDKLSSNVPVTVSVPSGSIRTINGKGYTDSLGGSISSAITLLSTGSNGNVLSRINASTPLTRTVTTSTSGETSDVVLGVYDVKSENQMSTLNTVNFTIQNSTNGATSTAQIFTTIRLTDGVNTYATSSASSTAVTFTNLNIQLPQDQWKSLTLKANVRDQDEFRQVLWHHQHLLQ